MIDDKRTFIQENLSNYGIKILMNILQLSKSRIYELNKTIIDDLTKTTRVKKPKKHGISKRLQV